MAAPTGTASERVVQMGWETTRMTLHAATYVYPFLSFDPNPIKERSRRPVYRGSRFREFMPPLVTKSRVEISGHEVIPTYEEWPAYMGVAWKKVAAGTPDVATTAYTTVHSTTSASDDRATATLEYGNGTQAYVAPGCGINKVEFGYEEGGPCTLSMDWLGQQWNEQAVTSALSPLAGLEEIDSTTAAITLDDTTIGTTASLHPSSFKWTLDGRYVQGYAPDGFAYPNDMWSSEGIGINFEMALKFGSKAEFAKAMSTTERKIRVKFTGSVIAGSTGSAHKTLTFDLYGYWDTHPFSLSDGRIMTTLSGGSVYDTTATNDASTTVVNAIAAYS